MVSPKKNEMLTRVGPGTPCGNLMRRYWHPIYPEILLRDKPVRKVRILGENLTLYRDAGNRLGLIAERCPHRRTSLSQGIPEAEGLRCCYHGWLFNAQGECLEMPLEPSNTRMLRNIKITAYPVQAMGGLIWAYLGPEPAPALPRWDLFIRPGGFRQIVAHRLPVIGCRSWKIAAIWVTRCLPMDACSSMSSPSRGGCMTTRPHATTQP